jgi:flagellar motor switch protein FliN/FliY
MMADEPEPKDVESVEDAQASADDTATTAATRETAADASDAAVAPVPGLSPDDVKLPEFAQLRESSGRGSGTLERFYNVHVPIWAELGRVELPLGELIKLSEGAVVRLERPVSEPVDIVSQGVKLARGEVIVIDDCFAVRIKEIITTK